MNIYKVLMTIDCIAIAWLINYARIEYLKHYKTR